MRHRYLALFKEGQIFMLKQGCQCRALLIKLANLVMMRTDDDGSPEHSNVYNQSTDRRVRACNDFLT